MLQELGSSVGWMRFTAGVALILVKCACELCVACDYMTLVFQVPQKCTRLGYPLV